MPTIETAPIFREESKYHRISVITLLHFLQKTGRYCTVIATCLFLSNYVIAQNLDSLEKEVNLKTLPVKEKIRIYDDLSWGYNSIDYLKAVKYSRKGIALAEQENDKKMVATFLRNTGVAYYMASMNDSAMVYFAKALQIATLIGDINLQSAIYGAYGNLYNVQGDYKKALDYYLKALPLAEKMKKKQTVRPLLGNIGSLFNSLKNYAQAAKYFRKSLNLSLELNDISGLGMAYDGLATVFMMQEKVDSAIAYQTLAIEAFKQTGEKHFEAVSVSGLAMLYYKHKNDYKNAEKYGLIALSLSEETEMPSYIAGSLNTLSNICLAQKKFAECLAYAQKGIETDTMDFNVYSNFVANVALSNIYLGNKDEAKFYFDKYTSMINDRANENYQKSISETEIKYETEKKEMQIAALLKQKKLYGTIAIATITIILLLLLSVFFRYRLAKQKKLMAEQEVINLEQEKKLIATQSILEGENAERSRIARDLHDGLGGLLSGVKLNLANLKGNFVLSQETSDNFSNTLNLLDNSINELRRIARNMMPESLVKFGLKDSLQDFCSQIESGKKMKVQFQFFGEEKRAESIIENAVYRIAQELINNSIKHAEADEILVQLIQQTTRLHLTVQDNGKGFDLNKVDTSKSSGLKNIRARVESFNGKLDIISEPGKGTEVSVEFIFG